MPQPAPETAPEHRPTAPVPEAGGPHLYPAPDPPPEGAAEVPPEGGFDTAADMTRLAAWAAATFRPPQVWTERPLSAAEALEVARANQAPGRWAALRRGYGYAAAGATALVVAVVWLIQSPARLATGLLVAAIALLSLYLLIA